MGETQFLVELLKQIGIAGVVFVIWLLYHRHQVELFKQIINEQSEREKRNFEILKQFIETLEYHASSLARIETKIDKLKEKLP